MTPYTPADNFAASINIYDLTDPVIGASGGVSNNPVKALADRTEYLFNRQGRYLAHRRVTAAAAITPADRGKLIHAISIANISLTLNAVATFPVGAQIDIKAKTQAAGKAIRIVPNASEVIEDGVINYTVNGLYLHDGEIIRLIAADADNNGTADYWELVDLKTNLEKVASDGLVRIQPRNSAIADGTLVNRADYPRVWAAIAADAVDDGTWLSDAVRYRQFFSAGNGTTTFRWPDMRSMVWKGLDIGRGLSLTRLDNFPGGLEKDAVLEHYHIVTINPNADNQSGSGKVVVGGTANEGTPPQFKTAGAVDGANNLIGNTENLIKTTGLLPVIFY